MVPAHLALEISPDTTNTSGAGRTKQSVKTRAESNRHEYVGANCADILLLLLRLRLRHVFLVSQSLTESLYTKLLLRLAVVVQMLKARARA